MIRLMLTALLLGATAYGAAAHQTANTPRLKELVTVASDLVLIGDLVEDAGPAANIPVFRAPDLGETGAVDVSRVVEALRPHHIDNLDTAGLSQIVVTRLSRAITTAEIEQRLLRAFARHYGLGEAENLTLTPDRPLRTMHVEATAIGDLAIARINVDQHSGRFDVVFELPGSAAARRQPLRVTGVVGETVETAVLVQALARGEVIKTSDFTVERRRKSDPLTGAIVPDRAVGLAAKRPLRVGEVLRANELMRPEVVRRNESVTIVYQTPGLTLTVRGKALEAGAVGDMINVSNVQSNRTVQATVEAPGRVSIAPPLSLVAAATAPVAAAQPPVAVAAEHPETLRTP